LQTSPAFSPCKEGFSPLLRILEDAGLRNGALNQPIELQRSFWNDWNAHNRENRLSEVSQDQRAAVIGWLRQIGRTNLDILEVGCGAGWLCPSLLQFGQVTATDLSDEVLVRAAERMPEVRFVAGDFMDLEFEREGFDVVVSLEVLSHVADHNAFVAKLASLLRPGGALIMATQNRPVLERHNKVPAPQPGNLRKWFDRDELTDLLTPHVEVQELRSLTPVANRGPLRLFAGRQASGFVAALSRRRRRRHCERQNGERRQRESFQSLHDIPLLRAP
jgi:SAM-dependent methyltransferase